MHTSKPPISPLVLLLIFSAAQWRLPAKEPSPMELARQLNQAFVEVAEKVAPAVVVIQVAHKSDYLDADSGNNPFFDLLPELKRRWEEQRKNHPRPRADREPIYDAEGSGIIIREDGYI